MKGLIIKDIFALKQQGKVLLFLLAFYALYSVLFDNLSVLAGVIVLVCVIMPITTMAYDEKSKWERYALAMPVERKTMVLSKYVFALMAELIGVILVGILSLIIVVFTGEMQLNEALLMILGIGGIGLIFLAIILPLLFQFGVEKARLIILMVVFIPSMLAMMLSRLGMSPPSPHTLKLAGYLSPLIIAGLLLLSMKISMRIYDKKEF